MNALSARLRRTQPNVARKPRPRRMRKSVYQLRQSEKARRQEMRRRPRSRAASASAARGALSTAAETAAAAPDAPSPIVRAAPTSGHRRSPVQPAADVLRQRDAGQRRGRRVRPVAADQNEPDKCQGSESCCVSPSLAKAPSSSLRGSDFVIIRGTWCRCVCSCSTHARRLAPRRVRLQSTLPLGVLLLSAPRAVRVLSAG